VEKARIELEKKEEMRQRRKLEFLITQAELYSHFIEKKLKSEWTIFTLLRVGI
jgi:DNA helicase INO80